VAGRGVTDSAVAEGVMDSAAWPAAREVEVSDLVLEEEAPVEAEEGVVPVAAPARSPHAPNVGSRQLSCSMCSRIG